MSTHYVAHIKIERVDKPDQPDANDVVRAFNGGRAAEAQRMFAEMFLKRSVTELTSVVVKDITMERLIERAKAHIDLSNLNDLGSLEGAGRHEG